MVDNHGYWTDRVAVVTGAGGAMGGALTKSLIARGALIAGFDNSEALALTAADLGERRNRFLALPVDVGVKEHIDDAFAQVDKEFGPTTLLANFAAVNSKPTSVLESDVEEWDRVMAVNLAGTFWCCQNAMRQMIDNELQGSIVNIASTNALMGRRQFPTHVYAASKAGVLGMTVSLASEGGPHGIRINCILPGMHQSPMQRASAGSKEAAERFIETAVRATPLGRPGEPEDMVGPVSFLLGPESAYMTGQLISNDGGRSTWYE